MRTSTSGSLSFLTYYGILQLGVLGVILLRALCGSEVSVANLSSFRYGWPLQKLLGNKVSAYLLKKKLIVYLVVTPELLR